MKVLLINGSPNAKGCTYTALNEISNELMQAGVETEIFHIGKKPIGGCIACNKCSGVNRCIFDQDTVNVAIEKLENVDGVIFGSPVYYASANGSMISFMDRLFHAGKCFAHKPAACIASARRGGTTATLDQMNKYLSFAQMPIVSSQYWPMVHGSNPEDVQKDEEGLQTMRVLGRNMAWLLQCIEAGKKAGVSLPEKEKRIWTNFIR